MTDGDIHNRDGKIRNTTERIQNLKEISEENRQHLLDFKEHLFSENLSKDRISRHLYTWVRLVEYVDFQLDEVEKRDLVRLVGKVNRSEISDKDQLADTTKAEYRKSIRKFYKDFLGNRREDIDGEELTDFFTVTASAPTADPEELPMPRHVRQLVKNCDRSRDKAFIMSLWSSGGRIGEILGMKWKDVSFTDEIAKVRFRETKTGGSRTVPLTAGYLYLKELQEKDSRSSERDAYVFRSLTTDDQLSHNGACNIIKRANEKGSSEDSVSGKIRLNPHAFRKGRATYLASQGMNQAQICEYFGWVQGSDKAAKYIRMAQKDVESGIKKVAGYEIEEEERDLHPVKCPSCGAANKFEAETCQECDEVMTTSELFSKVKIDEATKKLHKRIITERTGLDDEKINEHAKQIVAEDLGVGMEEIES
jgi:integrase/recombinase XerD